MLPPRFDELPAEICTSILSQIPDWSTLKALISASPQYLHAYSASRTRILPCVVRNQINADPKALILHNIQTCVDSGADLAKVLDVLQGKAQELVESITLEHARATLNLDWIISTFIERFAISRIGIITGLLRSSNPEFAAGVEGTPIESGLTYLLSEIEYQRLKRAFYNLEIYHYICHTLKRVPYAARSESETLAMTTFFKSMQLYEWEEFCCVAEYLYDEMQHFCTKVDSEFVSHFEKAGPTSVNEDLTFSRERFWEEDSFFSEESHGSMREEWKKVALGCGLRKFKAMVLDDNLEDHFEIARSIELVGLSLFQEDVAEMVRQEVRKNPWERVGHKIGLENQQQETSMTGNSALQRYVASLKKTQLIPFGPRLHYMRRWGYAVWDDERFRKVDMSLFVQRDMSKCRCLRTQQDRAHSAEYRVRHIEKGWYDQGLLPKSYWNRIKHWTEGTDQTDIESHGE